LAANRLEVGSSLVNNVDKYAANLASNVPDHWEDSAGVGACFPQDMVSSSSFPDMLVWILHDYWLHCVYAGDRARMRDGLFPVLRQAVNSYRNYLKDNPVESDDGTIHIKNSWSPEYPGGRGQDINFTIGLMRWACRTLLDINEEHNLNDPLASEWQHILDNLVGFQMDENGLRIGKDVPFDKPHRHYSHLLPFYPLAIITPDKEEDATLLRTSLDHWLDVTLDGGNKRATGYTCTGGASMYAWLGDGKTAYEYLDLFIHHPGVAPTTMYAEGGHNPVIESPLSYATAMHDMLLQSQERLKIENCKLKTGEGAVSNGNTDRAVVIRVFPAVPEEWSDIAFKNLRTQGAFLVSAKRTAGVTQFVTVKSLAGSPCFVQTDIPKPKIYINGVPAGKNQVRRDKDGMYQISLKTGETATFTPVNLKKPDLEISPIPVADTNRNLFGLSEKTTRLTGHMNYYEN
jgi:hypothetical protein